jgi:Tetratricopeptide repeat/NB-ARC domain
VVPEQSATYNGPRVENVGLSVDHFNLIKFGSRTADYELILLKLIEKITPIASQRQHLYSVPLGTARSYTQRPSLSSSIEEKLHKHDRQHGAPHALAIYGLGGSGKTQLVLNYIAEHKDDYSPILWIDAQDPETTLSSFYRCAGELQLEVSRDSTQASALVDSATIQIVLRWLQDQKESDHEWLVVLDNADDLTWGLSRIVPRGRRGNVIITSQDEKSARLLNSECEKLQVGTMEPSEARSLLLRQLNLDPDSAPKHIQVICDTIVERLGYLALAIDLAGARIDENPDQEEALKRYLDDYDKHQDELLQRADFRGLSMSKKTVWTVWETTLDKIEDQYPEVRPALAFFAHFKKGIIQDELFRLASLGFSAIDGELGQQYVDLPNWLKQLTKIDGQKWDSFYYREALRPLLRYSLVQPVIEKWPGASMHNLVQWRATKYMESQPWDSWYLMFMVAVCHQVTKEESNPEFRRHMVTHIPDVSQSYLVALKVHDKYRAFVCDKISHVYHNEGRWKEAEELQIQVMETRKRVQGHEHPSTLTSMNNLASTFQDQGRWKEAEELQIQVIETTKRVLGHEHPHTLSSMNNLSSAFQDQGRWEEAEELQIQVMETRKRVLGHEHPDTLSSMNNLASTFQDQGRRKEAEELQIQVMETRKRVQGHKHPDTLTSIHNLASTFQDQGRWEEAEELQIQVMETRKRVLGHEHPSTLTSMHNLAFAFQDQWRWEEAEELQIQVMETRKKVQGHEHPSTLTSIQNLASTFQDQGRWKEAEELQIQVMETRKRVQGHEHPHTLSSMNNLASIFSDQGRWEKAEELEIQVMKTRKRVLGHEHPDTLTSMNNLASTFWDQGRWKEAEELQIQAMETRKRVQGQEHPATLTAMYNLAMTWKHQDYNGKALALMAEVVHLREKKLGVNHPHTKQSIRALEDWQAGG